jgi:hypothetical protein
MKMKNRLRDYPGEFWTTVGIDLGSDPGSDPDQAPDPVEVIAGLPTIVEAIQEYCNAIKTVHPTMDENKDAFAKRYLQPAKELLKKAKEIVAILKQDCDKAQRYNNRKNETN